MFLQVLNHTHAKLAKRKKREKKIKVSGCPFTSKGTFTKELFNTDDVVYYHISLYRVRGNDNSYYHLSIHSPLLKFLKN